MRTSVANNRRGAARHWIIGCLVIIVIIVGMIGAGVWYVSKKVGFGVLDVAAKIDPPAEATVDQLLPATAGTFTRTAVTSSSTEMAGMMASVPGDHRMNATSGTVAALYTNPSKSSALVLAINSAEAKRSGSDKNPFESAAKGKGDPSQGFHVQSKFSAASLGMAGWSKANWTYAVLTTDTEVLDFANHFEPGK